MDQGISSSPLRKVFIISLEGVPALTKSSELESYNRSNSPGIQIRRVSLPIQIFNDIDCWETLYDAQAFTSKATRTSELGYDLARGGKQSGPEKCRHSWALQNIWPIREVPCLITGGSAVLWNIPCQAEDVGICWSLKSEKIEPGYLSYHTSMGRFSE